jgi:hypothetical protein
VKTIKRSFITTGLFIQVFSSALLGQAVMNSGFEDWTVIQHFEDPTGYNSSNVFSYFAGGEPNVTKVTDAVSGTYAIRLETVMTPEGIAEGTALIGTPEGSAFLGGIPYTERPDSITGYSKYEMFFEDTAYVAAVFKKFGAPIGIGLVQFSGVQDTYQYFSVAIEWLVPIVSPDTLAIALISSTIFGEPKPGSWMIADNISFVGPGDPFPNGDFEDWISFSAEEPDHWTTSNIFTLLSSSVSVTKSTDSHSGNFSARIENQSTLFNDTLGFITNGYLSDDGPAGGMAVDDVPEKLSGYYKYTPVDSDTAIGALTLYKYNPATGKPTMLDSAYVALPAADDWTYFEIPVDYYSLPEPDTVNIAFSSGNLDKLGVLVPVGSQLWIDDLAITYKPHLVGTDEKRKDQPFTVYPNPANRALVVDLSNLIRQPVEVSLYNTSGDRIVIKKGLAGGSMTFDVEDLTAGIYFYRIKTAQQTYQGKFVVR